MYLCPQCRSELQGAVAQGWICPTCGGRAVNLTLLRQTVQPGSINQIWRSAFDEQGSRGRPCPACRQPMLVVPVALPAANFDIDVCKSCQFFWFDADEFQALPPLPPPEPPPREQQPARLGLPEQLAMWRVQRMGEHQARVTKFEQLGPDEWWQKAAAFFGLPIKIDNPVHQWPWVTWGLTAVTVLVSMFTFRDLHPAIARYGLIPSQAGRLGGLTWITSFFLHGGVIHLLSNMYFLLVFGDNVEECVGRWYVVLLIGASALFGGILHVAFDPHSNVPLIGASGGISGIIVFYALQFPNARLGFLGLFGFIYYLGWVTVSTSGALIVWMALQFIGALQQIEGFSSVSSLAHLGGAATGFAFWLVLRGRSPALATD